MKTVLIILAVIVGILALLWFVGGFVMFCFAVVRQRHGSRQIDYWQPGTENSGEYLPVMKEEFKTIVIEGMTALREKAAEKVYIDSRDGLKLCAHVMENPDSVGVAIMFHGYRSSGAFDFAPSAMTVAGKGFTLLIPDLRGHGESEGNYIGFGVLDRYDAADWAEYAVKRWGKPVILFGVSMGSATVMMGAGVGYPAEVRAMIADCGFTTAGEIGRKCLKQWFRLPPFPLYYGAKMWTRLIAKYDLDSVSSRKSLEKLRGTGIKVLMVHGRKDDFVPYEMSVENYKAFDYMPAGARAEATELFTVDEALHATSYLVDREGYLAALDRLLKKAGF